MFYAYVIRLGYLSLSIAPVLIFRFDLENECELFGEWLGRANNAE